MTRDEQLDLMHKEFRRKWRNAFFTIVFIALALFIENRTPFIEIMLGLIGGVVLCEAVKDCTHGNKILSLIEKEKKSV